MGCGGGSRSPSRPPLGPAHATSSLVFSSSPSQSERSCRISPACRRNSRSTSSTLGRSFSVPGRTQPPVLARPLQPALKQPQQAQRHTQGLGGPLDRGLGPGPALFPTQPLLEIPEAVLLAEPSRQTTPPSAGRSTRAELTRLKRWRYPQLGDHRLDRHFRPGDRHRHTTSFQRTCRTRP